MRLKHSKVNDSDKKRRCVLMPFSGGLDSTYLAYWYQSHGWDVECFYVKGNQSTWKIEAEEKAVAKLTERFQADQSIPGSFRNLGSFDLTALHQFSLAGGGFDQVAYWLFPLLKLTSEHHTEVAMAYVMGDGISAMLPALSEAYANLVPIVRVLREPPELVFPLAMMEKTAFLPYLPEQYKAAIWVCELPNRDSETQDLIPCGVCSPCRRHANVREHVENKYSNIAASHFSKHIGDLSNYSPSEPKDSGAFE